MARLGDICAINMGQSPDSVSYNEVGEGLPFFQGNADFGTLHPKVRVWCNAPTKIAHEGDILISVRAPIGALNIADTECCIGRGLAALTVDTSVCSKKYLWYAIASKVDELISKGTGSTFKAINKNILEETTLPLPTLQEQSYITQLLDKISNMILLRKQQLQKLDDLVKARFVEMFSEFISTTKHYVLGDISEFVSVGIANSATHAYADTGVVMLRNQNIKENYLDDSDLIHIDPDFAALYKSKKLKENDILVIRTGYPGVACLVPAKYEGCQTFTTLIVRLKHSADYLPLYICHYINSQYGKAYVDEMKVGVAQQNFGAKALEKMPIAIPPIDKQLQFETVVRQANKSKLTIQQGLDKLEVLKKALIQKYFG